MVKISLRRSSVPPVAAALAVFLLSGCAVPDDKLASMMVAPGKFTLYTCPELVAKAKDLAARQQQLAGLMAKAGEGAGGRLAATVAYRPEYLSARGEMRDVREAAAQKQCDLSGIDAAGADGAAPSQAAPR